MGPLRRLRPGSGATRHCGPSGLDVPEVAAKQPLRDVHVRHPAALTPGPGRLSCCYFAEILAFATLGPSRAGKLNLFMQRSVIM